MEYLSHVYVLVLDIASSRILDLTTVYIICSPFSRLSNFDELVPVFKNQKLCEAWLRSHASLL